MAAFEYAAGDYKLACETKENGIIVTGIRGNGSNLTIPEEIIYQDKEYPVLEIGKKAALGCRTVREIFVPDTVVATGDWAFAQCPQLTNIRIPQGVSLGVGVFEDCPSLLQICVEAAKEDFSLDLSILLAVCVRRLPSEDLLRDSEVGSEHWFRRWDQRLVTFLKEEDKEGYLHMVLCGEEDIRKNVPEFILEKQMDKSSLCLIRLLYHENLDMEYRDFYIRYILSHGKGCPSEAAWKALAERFSDRMVFFDLFADIGGITKDTVDAMIEDLTEQQAEAKAYLIRYKQEHFGDEDIFAGFEL